MLHFIAHTFTSVQPQVFSCLLFSPFLLLPGTWWRNVSHHALTENVCRRHSVSFVISSTSFEILRFMYHCQARSGICAYVAGFVVTALCCILKCGLQPGQALTERRHLLIHRIRSKDQVFKSNGWRYISFSVQLLLLFLFACLGGGGEGGGRGHVKVSEKIFAVCCKCESFVCSRAALFSLFCFNLGFVLTILFSTAHLQCCMLLCFAFKPRVCPHS